MVPGEVFSDGDDGLHALFMPGHDQELPLLLFVTSPHHWRFDFCLDNRNPSLSSLVLLWTGTMDNTWTSLCVVLIWIESSSRQGGSHLYSWRSGDRGRWVSVHWRPAWLTMQVSRHPGPCYTKKPCLEKPWDISRKWESSSHFHTTYCHVEV